MGQGDEGISDKLHKSDDDAIKPAVPLQWGSDEVPALSPPQTCHLCV
jgi:hypothetical protein